MIDQKKLEIQSLFIISDLFSSLMSNVTRFQISLMANGFAKLEFLVELSPKHNPEFENQFSVSSTVKLDYV